LSRDRSQKSFGNKFFLDFVEKITCSNVKAAVHIFALVFPESHVTAAKKVLGTSFSWISGKKSLVPT
jgi:hypothetical protein